MELSVLFSDDSGSIKKYLDKSTEHINTINFDMTPLMNAVCQENIDVIDVLIDYGCDIQFKNKNGYTALLCYFISQSNNRVILQKLLNSKVDINISSVDGNTPLHYAAYYITDVNIIHYITLECNPNLKNNNRKTPLMLACEYNKNIEVIAALIDITNDINIQDNFGNTALHLACINNKYDIIKILLNGHADINITNDDNETPYDYADRKGKFILNML